MFNNIPSEVIIEREEGEPVIEKTKFGCTVHGGAEGTMNMCMFTNSCEDEYRKLYSWNVLSLQDDAEHSQDTVYDEFKENITRTKEGRFQVKLSWIPNHPELKSKEQPARRRLQNTVRELSEDPETKLVYDQIIEQQLNEGVKDF